MKKLTYTLLGYGGIILTGGLIGFIKAGSLPSLIMSSIFASLIFLCTYLMQNKFKLGYYGALSIAIFLALFFGYRFFLSQTFMPSGLMLFISTLMTARLFIFKTSIATKKCV